MKAFSRTLALALGLALVCAAPAPARDAATQAALDRGFQWLKEHQKPNGAWSDENYPARTALGLWAAAQGGREDLKEPCERAARLRRRIPRRTRIYKPARAAAGPAAVHLQTAIC